MGHVNLLKLVYIGYIFVFIDTSEASEVLWYGKMNEQVLSFA